MVRTVRGLVVLSALAGLLACGVLFASAATNGTDAAPAALVQYTPPSKGGGGGGGGGGGSALPPDLVVTVSTSASSTPAVGGELDFYLTVKTKNIGGASATSLQLTLPDGWTYKSSYADRGSGCSGTPPTLQCNTGWINPGASTNITLFGTVAQAGDLTFVATIKSLQEPEADPSNNTTTVKLTPAGSSTQTSKPPGTQPSPVTTTLPVLVVPAFAKVGSVLRIPKAKGATYVWQICISTCRVIPGATKATLKLTNAFAGHSVRVVVHAGGKTKTSKKVKVKISVS